MPKVSGTFPCSCSCTFQVHPLKSLSEPNPQSPQQIPDCRVPGAPAVPERTRSEAKQGFPFFSRTILECRTVFILNSQTPGRWFWLKHLPGKCEDQGLEPKTQINTIISRHAGSPVTTVLDCQSKARTAALMSSAFDRDTVPQRIQRKNKEG